MTPNILFLCHRLPYPPNKGDKIRSYALLRHLAERGTVSVACFIDDPDDLKYLDTVRALARGRCYFEYLSPAAKIRRSLFALAEGKPITTACFGSRRLQQWIDRILHHMRFDDVVIFGSAMAPYLMNAHLQAECVLFDMVDIDSDKWRQYAAGSSGLSRWIYKREARTLELLECEAARVFGRTLLVSDFEAQTFRSIASSSAPKIGALTNGVDLDVYSPGAFENPFPEGELSIVMTGRMDYRPNYEGALWFTKEILPHILKSLPNARVYFVGAAPPRALRAVSCANVVVTGQIADVRPYLQFAKTVIAPLRIARGVQNKVLEALAMAKPVVATTDATRSLGVEPGVHLWIENSPVHFAEAVSAALQGPRREEVAQNGRRYVERHHSWSRLLTDLDLQLDRLQRPVPAAGQSFAQYVPAESELRSVRWGAGI